MYTNVSPLGCAYYTLVGLTLGFLWVTGMVFQQWRIESAGVSSPGTVVAVTPCYDSHGKRLATVHLTVQFVDSHGAQHDAQTLCEYDRYPVGQTLAVRYLPSDPDHILIPADIGGGQGSTLVNMLLLDLLFIVVSIVGAMYGMRAGRRAQTLKDAQTRELHAFNQTRIQGGQKSSLSRWQLPIPHHYLRRSSRTGG